jgi:hypothetical protein
MSAQAASAFLQLGRRFSGDGSFENTLVTLIFKKWLLKK